MLKKLLLLTSLVASLISSEIKTNFTFGEELFQGKFQNDMNYFNSNYTINFKDKLQINIWGEFEFSEVLAVDLRGNIFIPKIGVVKAQGKTSDELLKVIQHKIKTFYTSNIFCYINLLSYEKINVVVGGNIKTPGSYSGYPNDLILNFIDKAGGISKGGSYRNIEIHRQNKVIKNIDLYEFLNKGVLAQFQFENGDTIFIKNTDNFINLYKDNQKIKYEIDGIKEFFFYS